MSKRPPVAYCMRSYSSLWETKWRRCCGRSYDVLDLGPVLWPSRRPTCFGGWLRTLQALHTDPHDAGWIVCLTYRLNLALNRDGSSFLKASQISYQFSIFLVDRISSGHNILRSGNVLQDVHCGESCCVLQGALSIIWPGCWIGQEAIVNVNRH